MTTTQHLQIGTEFYSTIEECKSHVLTRKNTNARYSSYCQIHFTVGDEQQFEKYRNKYTNDESCHFHCNDCKHIKMWSKFESLNASSVKNTFNYIFHKFKKGIFIQLRENKVNVMLPFSKHNYINEWSRRIQYDKRKYNNIIDVFERVYRLDNRPFKRKYINKFTDQWYGNNAIFRYEYPIRENDSGVAIISHMFKELCDRYDDIPDIEVFINKRDFPLIRKDGCEAYNYIFGNNTPLISHKYDTYAPILSMCGGDDFADILIPTWDDWARICSQEQKYFPKCPQYYNEPPTFNIPWEQRIPTAVFRGSSTGVGTTIDTNMRLKVAKISLENRKDVDGCSFLNAGITAWNIRPRINKNTQYIDTFDDDIIQMPLVSYMNLTEQASYKYIINIDGHVSAYRLSAELGTGSVVLLVQSMYKLWFSDELKPYVHYVPINSDLSDLYDQIKWCKQNDEKCREIAENAKQFYNTYLQKDGILSYLHTTLKSIRCKTGYYKYTKSPHHIIFEKEKDLIRNINIPELEHSFRPGVIKLPPYKRSYDLLQGVQWFLNTNDIQLLELYESKYINKKTTLNIYTLDSMKIVEKIPSSDDQLPEIVNEMTIGTYCINPLLKYIPNFAYTFKFANNHLFTEYIEHSQTFFDYLVGDSFDMNEYFSIMMQITLSIHVAQQYCLFIHYDLYPWNIVLKKYEQPIDIYYLVDTINIQYYKVTTSVVPIIIDYGKSRGVINGHYYGILKPTYNSTIHDILSILISSMYNLINTRNLNNKELRQIFELSTFISGTKYTQGKTFNKTRDLKQFLSNHKKYAQMIETPKYELEEKTPLDFVHFLTKRFHCKFSIPLNIQYNMRMGTSRHVYEYIVSNDKNYTWKNILARIQQNSLIQDEYSSFAYEIFDQILNSIRDIHPEIPSSVIEETHDIIQSLRFTQLDHPIHTLDISTNTKSYDLNIFDNQKLCKKMHEYFNKQDVLSHKFIQTKQMIIDNITYKINNGENVNSLIQTYKDIICVDNIQYMTCMANRNTFIDLVEKINN
jgi:hypothetical protein